MFIGHFALGFGAKRLTPRVPLPVLLAGAQFADLAWPFFVASGIEEVRIDPGNTAFTPLDFVRYPYSHSLLALIFWGLILGLAYRMFRRDRLAIPVLGTLVVSHWVLDFVTHRPDMPVYPGGPKFGLGLWNSVAGTMSVEFALFGAGVFLYLTATRARDRVGKWALAALIALLVIVYLAAFAGPPPSVSALWPSAIAGAVVILAWSAWVDRHREPG